MMALMKSITKPARQKIPKAQLKAPIKYAAVARGGANATTCAYQTATVTRLMHAMMMWVFV